MQTEEPLVAEAIRIYRRYAIEIVERLGLCPWAEQSRKSGRVEERVLLVEQPEVAPALAAIAEVAARAGIEILLLLFPRLQLERRRFEHYLGAIRDADAKRHELGRIPFAMAAFHPDAEPELGDPELLIPFLRKTPDPTIQLVRRTVLERVRARSPDGTGFVDLRLLSDYPEMPVPAPTLRERIATANRSTVLGVGVDVVEALLAEIRRDRDESYARAGSPQSAVTPQEETL
jgi:hypothetical protein